MTMKKISALLALPAFVFLMMPDAMAQDGTDWLSKDRFQLRGRVIGVLPEGDGHVNGTSMKTDVGDAVTPEIDLTYFLTDNIGLEVIAATAQHEIYANSSNLGNTWILPPTVTLQYHFMRDQKFSPYIGAGLNYSWFYGEDDGAGFDDLDVKGGFGYALQAGFDYWFSDNWGLNVDAKYIDLDVDVKVNSGGTALSADDVELNPFILGAGVSYRF